MKTEGQGGLLAASIISPVDEVILTAGLLANFSAFSRRALSAGSKALGAAYDGVKNFFKGGNKKPSNVGDLSKGEVKEIQSVVDEAARSLEVVGSAAKGERRDPGSDLPIGKGEGTKSDIDNLVPPSSMQHYKDVQKNLPEIDPNSGIIPGTHNPERGPAIRFEPNTPPKKID